MSKSDRQCTIAECRDELDRELQVRKRCYDRWVGEGKLSGTEARDRIDRLSGAIDYLSQAEELLAAMEKKAVDKKGETE